MLVTNSRAKLYDQATLFIGRVCAYHSSLSHFDSS